MLFNSLSLGLILSPYASAQLGDVTLETWRVPQMYPEGIAFDSFNNRILLSSLVSNTIVALDPANDMSLQTTYTPATDNPSGMGLKVDENSVVHVTITDFAAMDDGGYASYELPLSDLETADATIVSAPIYMPCTNGTSSCGMANDIVVGADGVLYVTDSMFGRVFKVENGVMEEVASDPLLQWMDPSFPFGSNGLVYDDRGFLVVGNTATSSLIRVDLETNDVLTIPMEGEIGNVDGMLMDSNGRIYVITGTTIYAVEDNDDEWRSASMVGTIDIDNSADGESAATATFGETESEIYITFVRFGDLFGGGTNEDPSLLAKVTLVGGGTTATIPLVADDLSGSGSGLTEVPAGLPQEPSATSFGELVQTWRVAQQYPEGISYDKTNQRILLSSLVSNSIVALALDPADDMILQTVYTEETENPGGMGLKVDPSTGQVHATITNFEGMDNGGYAVFDVAMSDSNQASATSVSVPLFMPCTNGTTSCGMANDVIITENGVAYVTDSMFGRVFKVENGIMEEVASDPLLQWVDPSFPFGSNGLVYDDRGFLVVGNTATSSLIRVDLATSEVVTIPLEGEIGNVDGMLMNSDGRVYVITGTTVYVLEDNSDDWKSATVLGTIDIDQSAEGESATTATFGETESEMYITYVRFGDLFGGEKNENPALLAKVSLGSGDVSGAVTTVSATGAPLSGSTGVPATTSAGPAAASEVPESTTEASAAAEAPGTAATDSPASDGSAMGEVTQTWRVDQQYPEGIAYDKTNKRVLLSSLVSNSIVALDASTPDMVLEANYAEETDNPGGMGLKFDLGTGQVHAMITNFEGMDNGGYAVYDLQMNDLIAVANVVSSPVYMPCTNGTTSCGMANDVVITESGVAYMTDSMFGRVFKVEDGVMEELTSDPLLQWVDPNFPFGSNGLVHDDRGFLVVGNTATSSLIRVDLETNEAVNIPLEGEIGNVDGMLMDSNGRIYVITGTTVYVVEDNDDDWQSATVLGTINIDHSAEGESATTATFGETESEMYITYVRFGDLFGTGKNNDPALLAKVTLFDVALTGETSSTVSASPGTGTGPDEPEIEESPDSTGEDAVEESADSVEGDGEVDEEEVTTDKEAEGFVEGGDDNGAHVKPIRFGIIICFVFSMMV